MVIAEWGLETKRDLAINRLKLFAFIDSVWNRKKPIIFWNKILKFWLRDAPHDWKLSFACYLDAVRLNVSKYINISNTLWKQYQQTGTFQDRITLIHNNQCNVTLKQDMTTRHTRC